MRNSGRLAQSGRALPLQGRSHRFKSRSAHKGFSEIYPAKNTKDPQKTLFIHKLRSCGLIINVFKNSYCFKRLGVNSPKTFSYGFILKIS